MSIKDGGPAFPSLSVARDVEGMSLRDWFAGQAISGGLADRAYVSDYRDIAEFCYRLADAMLKAREKKAGD